MSENTGFGQQTGSQTGSDTDGRSPEYRDNLTVQDETRAAGSSGIQQPSTDYDDTATGIRAAGAGADDLSGYRSEQTGLNVERDTAPGQSAYDASDRRAMGDNTDGLGRDQTDRVTADETGTLISADKVQGTAVYDGTGERLGTIDSLMLNKRSGKVAYAVMSFGGFLGIGERYHPLPWDKLTYDTDKGGYNIGATQDELRAGPTYSRDELETFERDGRGGSNEVDDYYGRSATQGSALGGNTAY